MCLVAPTRALSVSPTTPILTGRKDTAGNTLGWTVNWENSDLNAHSVTTWSGQLQLNEGLEYYDILTTWLLTSQTIPEDNWESTQVGFDYFTQNPPSEQTKKNIVPAIQITVIIFTLV